jgi:hypothetical protein
MPENLDFRGLPSGARFEFANRPNGFASGPWIKISARRYQHADSGMICAVGSVRVAVLRLESPRAEGSPPCRTS